MSTWKPAYHKDQRNMRTPTPLADIHQLKTILHEFRFAVLVSCNTKSRRINLFLSEGKLGIMAPREVKYPRIIFFLSVCLLTTMVRIPVISVTRSLIQDNLLSPGVWNKSGYHEKSQSWKEMSHSSGSGLQPQILGRLRQKEHQFKTCLVQNEFKTSLEN